MNLLHRHIFANVLLTCAAAVGLLAFVLMLANALKDLLPYLLSGQMDLDTFVRLLGLMVPFVAYYALPPGIMTGILLVLGRMSSDREVTALRASGLSVAWLSAPIIFIALCGVVAGLFINFHYMPVTRLAYQREKEEVVRQNPLSFILPRTFVREFPGIILYAGEKHDTQLKDLWVWELDDQKRVRRFARAEAGRIVYDEKNHKLVITLNRAQLEVRDDKDPENFSVVRGAAAWDQASFDLPLSSLTGDRVVQKKLKWYTFSQLVEEWRRLDKPDPALTVAERRDKQMRVQITLHEKFATAFSVLSFALVAVPLGIRVSRKETSANLGMGLLLALGYYFVTVMVGTIDKYPALRPDLLMWLPNLAFQSLGLWMFYKLDRGA